MTINAVERALVILKQLANAENGVGVRELGRKLALSPAVVQKSLQALVAQGFAEQNETTQLYYLGAAAIQVGLAGLAKLEIRHVARPYLELLVQYSGETALLGVRQGDVAVYIEKVLSRAEIRLDVPIGSRRPLNATAVGKAILAYLPEEEIERLHQSGAFTRLTENSITDLEMLKNEMAKVRATGIAIDDEEYAAGTTCFASPIWNHDGTIAGAVTMSGPTSRVISKREACIAQTVRCARDISLALGYQLEQTLTVIAG